MNDDTSKEVKCNCEWNARAWTNTKDYQYESCLRCNKIKSFYWKSFWRRLKCLFINETL